MENSCLVMSDTLAEGTSFEFPKNTNIVSAIYVATDGGGKTLGKQDCFEFLDLHLRTISSIFEVTNKNCGGEFMAGKPKELHVKFAMENLLSEEVITVLVYFKTPPPPLELKTHKPV